MWKVAFSLVSAFCTVVHFPVFGVPNLGYLPLVLVLVFEVFFEMECGCLWVCP